MKPMGEKGQSDGKVGEEGTGVVDAPTAQDKSLWTMIESIGRWDARWG